MKRIAYTTMGLLALLAVTASCDDGRLYADRLIIPEEGRVVKLTATLEGLDTWSDGYSIVLAGFEDGSDYTVIAKSVQAADDGTVDITMSGVAEEVTTLEVCAINRIRKRAWPLTMSWIAPHSVMIPSASMPAGWTWGCSPLSSRTSSTAPAPVATAKAVGWT